MTIIEEINDNVFAISSVVSTARERSWIPPGTEGHEPFNKYFFRSHNSALLIDTGVAAHRDNMLEALEKLLGSRDLTVMVTRSELECIGNLGSIVDKFPALRLLSVTKNLPLLGLAHFKIEPRITARARRIALGDTLDEFDFANLRVCEPLVRLLSTIWLIDEKTNSLFSSDFFSGDLMQKIDTPLQRHDMQNLPSIDFIRKHFLAKFDWFEEATTKGIQNRWDSFFQEFSPSMIAPSFGRIQVGPIITDCLIARYKEALFPSNCDF
ncbi:MAG: hypothetical protein WCK42_03070 [Myxococcaceae bacterium]